MTTPHVVGNLDGGPQPVVGFVRTERGFTPVYIGGGLIVLILIIILILILL